jgi:hypothetical protein
MDSWEEEKRAKECEQKSPAFDSLAVSILLPQPLGCNHRKPIILIFPTTI